VDGGVDPETAPLVIEAGAMFWWRAAPSSKSGTEAAIAAIRKCEQEE
jgi:hypothetical protein